jgi:hypothetical protein
MRSWFKETLAAGRESYVLIAFSLKNRLDDFMRRRMICDRNLRYISKDIMKRRKVCGDVQKNFRVLRSAVMGAADDGPVVASHFLKRILCITTRVCGKRETGRDLNFRKGGFQRFWWNHDIEMEQIARQITMIRRRLRKTMRSHGRKRRNLHISGYLFYTNYARPPDDSNCGKSSRTVMVDRRGANIMPTRGVEISTASI